VGTVDGDRIHSIEVGPGEETDSYAFAELTPASIAGVVFHDLDADGVQDAGELGIPDAQVTLSGAADLGPVTTDADGAYQFDNLLPGTYSVTATEATGFLDGLETAGTAGGTVGADNGDNVISAIALGAGEVATGYLFGDVQAASLAGTVFADTNGDGALDAGEAGIVGVEVRLTGTDLFGDPVDTTLSTIAAGAYLFADLLPGTYTVTETQPADYFDGIDTAGSAGGTVGADEVSDVVLGSGVVATGYLFAERAPAALSGVVFEDGDGDGIQDAGEPGIQGVTIALHEGPGLGDLITTDVTDATGAWAFEDLAPGSYSVAQQGQPISGYIDGATVVGSAGGTGAPNSVTGIELVSSASGYLFAEIPLAAIRGVVWHDADDDGVQDAGEASIPGVEITLSGDDDRTTDTAADGSFTFGGLEPGTYTITEEDLDNWSDGATVVGAGGGTAGVNTVTGIVLTPGADASGYGFGERAAQVQLVVETQTQDAQVEPGPYVAVGDPVRVTYRVINNGDTALSGIVVTDDALGEVECEATELAPAASLECTADTTALEGQQEHTASVTANVVPRETGVGVLAVTEVSSSDGAYYFGMIATAELSATVDGEASETAPGPVFENGRALSVVVTITNTGNVPLALESLDTGGLGALDCGAVASLLPDESVECTLDWTPPPGNYAFPLTATLSGPDATDVEGASVPTAVSGETTLFFQVLEAAVTPPTGIPSTGLAFDPRGLVLPIGVLLVGSVLLIIAIRRRDAAATSSDHAR
jgi:uncharacterized protein (DUF2141 family)